MTTLNDAPLVEVIFELRWGKQAESEIDSIQYLKEELEFFFGQFNKSAKENSYKIHERVNELPSGAGPAPFIIQHRFRKEENTWPCLQVGTGIFTVNQINDGYDWKPFKQSVIEGLEILNSGHPFGLKGMPLLSVSLMYRDGIKSKGGSESSDLENINSNLDLKLDLPSKFIDKPHEMDVNGFSIGSIQSDPDGYLELILRKATINGENGHILDMTLRSSNEDFGHEVEINRISDWLDRAHTVHKRSFESLFKGVE